jgi:hypothetical protein
VTSEEAEKEVPAFAFRSHNALALCRGAFDHPGNVAALGSGKAVVQAVLDFHMAVVAICVLFQFPFDLSEGDEGWAVVLLAGGATLFQWISGRRTVASRRDDDGSSFS